MVCLRSKRLYLFLLLHLPLLCSNMQRTAASFDSASFALTVDERNDTTARPLAKVQGAVPLLVHVMHTCTVCAYCTSIISVSAIYPMIMTYTRTYICNIYRGCVVYSVYVRPENQGQRKFAEHIPLDEGKGYMHCKLPMTKVGGSYKNGIHHVTMIHIIYTVIGCHF